MKAKGRHLCTARRRPFAPIDLPLSLLVMAFRAIVSDDGGVVGRRGIGPHWVAPIDLPLSLLVMAFWAIVADDGGDVGRRACGSEECFVELVVTSGNSP